MLLTAGWGIVGAGSSVGEGVEVTLECPGLQEGEGWTPLQRQPVGEATGAKVLWGLPLSLPVPFAPSSLRCPWYQQSPLPTGVRSLGPWSCPPLARPQQHGWPAAGSVGLTGRGWERRGVDQERCLACRFVWMLKLAACE